MPGPVKFKDILRAVSDASRFDEADIRGEPTRLSDTDIKRGREQRALQGSNSLFNRMSTRFLGTNEGGWAQGWGLYFTKAESARKYYSDAYARLWDFNEKYGDREISRKYINSRGETRDLSLPGQRYEQTGSAGAHRSQAYMEGSKDDDYVAGSAAWRGFNGIDSDGLYSVIESAPLSAISVDDFVEDIIAISMHARNEERRRVFDIPGKKSEAPDPGYEDFDFIRQQFIEKYTDDRETMDWYEEVDEERFLEEGWRPDPEESRVISQDREDLALKVIGNLASINEETYAKLAANIRPLNPKGYRYEAAIPMNKVLMDWDGVNDDLIKANKGLQEDLDALGIEWAGKPGERIYNDLVLQYTQGLNPHFADDFDNRDFDRLMDWVTDGKGNEKVVSGIAQQAASKFLRDRGVPGHRYRSHADNENFVIYDDRAVRALSRQEGFADPALLAGVAGIATGAGLLLTPEGQNDPEAMAAVQAAPNAAQYAQEDLQAALQQTDANAGMGFGDVAEATLDIGEVIGRSLLGMASRAGGILNPFSTPAEINAGAKAFSEGFTPSKGLEKFAKTETGQKVLGALGAVGEFTAPADEYLDQQADQSRVGNINVLLRDLVSPL